MIPLPSISRHIAACAIACLTTLGLTQDTSPRKRPAGPAADAVLLADAFPQTQDLLKHLATADPELFARLTDRGSALTKSIEADAIAFAREHHSELADLLVKLSKRRKKAAYSRAIRELIKDRSRVERARLRSPEDYATAIEMWRDRSRLRLLAARRALPPRSRRNADPSRQTPVVRSAQDQERDDAELKALLRKVQGQRRSGLQQRLTKLERHAERLRKRLAQDPDVTLQHELDAIRTRIQRRRQR